jgi:general secretion pathway protein M
MTAFWMARTLRERVLIMFLGLVSATYLLFVAIWQPLHRHRTTLTDDIARYARAATALSAIPNGSVAPPAVSADTPLPSIITDTAATFQLTIRRLQPSEGTADITLEDAPFDAVLLWIDALERDYGLRIITLTMTRRPEPGLVAAKLIIGR